MASWCARWYSYLVRDFRSLRAWQRGRELTLDVYRLTRSFPKTESYGLTAQIRRSAVSIPANIAEGAGRSSRKDYARFLDIALGSANELESHLLLAKDLGLLSTDNLRTLIESDIEIRRMLLKLRRSVSAGDVTRDS